MDGRLQPRARAYDDAHDTDEEDHSPDSFGFGRPVVEVAFALRKLTGQKFGEIELMLMERQRAFMELVSVTESLRSTVTRLQDELAQRDAEIARLRSIALPATG